MSAEIFIDTNVFVYHLDSTDQRKQGLAEQIVRDALFQGNACVSFQVVQEFLNTVLRKARVALPLDDARVYLDCVLLPLLEVGSSPTLYHRALDVRNRYRFSFYDSLIVAAALGAGCRQLLSEDLQNAQKIEGLEIVNPFYGT
jgi:predicted nucleic acid-binding protein